MPQPCCRHHIACPGAGNLDFDSPFANLSAEDPDRIKFIGLSWGWDNNVPGLGNYFLRRGCLAVCESEVSQADADACAARQQLICDNDEVIYIDHPSSGPPLLPPIGRPRPLFTNQQQTFISYCPDGIGFSYTVGPNKYIARSQVLADRMAMSEAKRFATTARMCLGTLDSEVCIGKFYEDTLTVSGGTAPFTFIVASGTLPPGLFIELLSEDPSTMILHGTVTTGGIYTFAIRVDDSTGLFMQKTFTINVTGIDNASLPNASVGVAYSEILTAGTMTIPLTWSISSGTLPAGLNLNSASGEIHGTPTTQQTKTFTVSVTDGASVTCTKQLSITVAAGCWIVGFPDTNDFLLGMVGQTGGAAGSNAVLGNQFVFKNQTKTIEVMPTVPDYPTDNGGVYGTNYPVTNRVWYMPFGGPAVQIGPLLFADIINHYGSPDSGYDLILDNTGGIPLGKVWSGSTLIATLGAAPGIFVVGDYPIGDNGHVLYWSAVTSTFHVWSPTTGDVDTTLNTNADRTGHLASNGYVVLASQLVPAGNYVALFWNGVTFTNINAANQLRARVNASGKVVGCYFGGTQFWYWTSGTGVVNIGLPPGCIAVPGNQAWITDSGLIVVQASNGITPQNWYYWNGVWGQLINIVPTSDPLWTAFLTIQAVNHAGYVVGTGTHGGTNIRYVCKLCSPP